jgi:pimeloyl-ACP methyl ester carboxylesterase
MRWDKVSDWLAIRTPASRKETARLLHPDSYDFARLSDGRCHYRIDGPSAGRPLLLIHGATMSSWQFDRVVPHMTEAGFRTIRLDLYGHGYSDRPSVTHDYDLFGRQVSELVELLDLPHEIDLLGYSLGAAIGARLVQASPRRFGSVIIAAPLLDFFANQPSARVLHLPIIGELVMDAYVVPMLVRRRARRYRDIEAGRFVRRLQDQLQLPGFGRSLLSLVRSGALGDQREAYAGLRALENRILLLRGREDPIFTPSQMKIIKMLAPSVECREIDGASHSMLLTHPHQVASEVLGFLKLR